MLGSDKAGRAISCEPANKQIAANRAPHFESQSVPVPAQIVERVNACASASSQASIEIHFACISSGITRTIHVPGNSILRTSPGQSKGGAPTASVINSTRPVVRLDQVERDAASVDRSELAYFIVNVEN